MQNNIKLNSSSQIKILLSILFFLGEERVVSVVYFDVISQQNFTCLLNGT